MWDIFEYQTNKRNHLYNSFEKAVVEGSFKSAVAVILKDSKVLLGRSKSKDERLGKYCFPGGRIDKGEDVYDAAVREAKEEAGVNCEIFGKDIIQLSHKKPVGFVICKYISGTPKPNWEFDSMEWFNINNLPKNILEINRIILEKMKI